MRIAVLFPGGIQSAWSLGDGVVNTLRRMGHEVLDYPRQRFGQSRIRKSDLESCNLIVVSAPEHIFKNPAMKPWGEIGPNEWEKLSVPKAGWYHESFFRDDIVFNFKELRTFTDYHFMPAIQDAEMFSKVEFGFKGRVHWLPFGVDTEVFRPLPCGRCKGTGKDAGLECGSCLGLGDVQERKDLGIGFIGTVYGIRGHFLDQLESHIKLPPGTSFVCGNVMVQDVNGISFQETAERLAANYRRIKVFLNLPSYSRLIVTKVLEVLACKTFLLTPVLTDSAEKNMDPLTHAKHLCFYRPSNLPFVNQLLNEFLERDIDRELIAQAGCKEVHEKHSLEVRLKQLLEETK